MIQVGDTVVAYKIDEQLVVIGASTTAQSAVASEKLLNIDDSCEEDPEALKGTLPRVAQNASSFGSNCAIYYEKWNQGSYGKVDEDNLSEEVVGSGGVLLSVNS